MSEIISVSVRSVDTITSEIIGIAGQTAQILFLSACEMGKRMLEAKELTGHGEWGAYLDGLCKQLGIGKSTAHNWMRMYQEYGDSPNFQALGNLNYTKAVKLLTLPEETREEILQENNVEDMSTRELEQAIREKKAAQEMLAIAQENTEDLRRQLDARQKENGKLQAALDKADSERAAALKDIQRLTENPEIPPEQQDKLRAEGRAKAQAEYDAKLKAAQEEAAEKECARKGMEDALVEAQKQIKELSARSKLSSQDAVSFEILYNQIVSSYNTMMGYLLKVEASDPELGKKFRYAAKRMGEKFVEAAEKRAAT